MNYLPIADRELRVAVRKRSTFWLRVAAALTGLVIGGGCLLLSKVFGANSVSLGGVLFNTLTWLCLVAGLSAGLFFTADCLSEEKREGTLGLLFLTDLRGYDVALGKLLATSLRMLLCPAGRAADPGDHAADGRCHRRAVLEGHVGPGKRIIRFAVGGPGRFGGQPGFAESADSGVLCAADVGLGGPLGGRHHRRSKTPHIPARGQPVQPSLCSDGGKRLEPLRILERAGRNAAHGLGAVGASLRAGAVHLAGPEERRGGHNPKLGLCLAIRRGVATPTTAPEADRARAVAWLASRERWQSRGLWTMAIVSVGGLVVALMRAPGMEVWMIWSYVGVLFTLLLYLWAASRPAGSSWRRAGAGCSSCC